MPNLGGGRDRALAAAARQPLLDGHRRRDTVHRIHLGPSGRLHDAARVGIERLEVAPLAFVEQDVERQRALAGAGHAGDDRELAARDGDVDALEVVLARVDDADRFVVVPARGGTAALADQRLQARAVLAVVAHAFGLVAGVLDRRVARVLLLGDVGRRVAFQPQRLLVVAQRASRVRARVGLQVLGRADAHQFAALLAAFRPEVDQPVSRADDVEVVLDDDQRVTGLQQAPQRAHQLGDVVEVQARGGLVEEEQRALPRSRLLRTLRGLGQEAGQLQALRLAARQRGHWLAQLHVVEADVDDGLQATDHLAVVGEQLHRLAHGQLQHVGDRQLAVAPHQVRVQHLGAKALAVAIGAAQVDVGQELHLDVLEARAAAGGAAAVAGVEREHARAVVALEGHRRGGEQLADLVERADVAGRVRARRLADRALVHEHGFRQPVRAQQRLVLAGRLRRLAEVARQRRVQHVLHQCALARAADAGDDDQPLQRELHRHVAQVVLGGALHDQPRRGLDHRAADAHAHLLARAQVRAGERVGQLRGFGLAVEHDLAALLARARAHVDQAVGREHHSRVVLHHHQRVAGVAQALHGLDDAVHVARMQADRRLVQHEQRVDQRRAQRRGEVDALHLAARQRAALAIEREVADADVVEVFQPRADLVEQQLQRVVGQVVRRVLHVEEASKTIDRQQHHVVQAQARQRLELLARPVDAVRHVALVGRQHAVGLLLGADAPQLRLELQARAVAHRALRVAAVLGQQHADVHLVGLRLEVLEEALDAVPLLVPVAVPVRRALDDPLALRLGQHVPRGVARNAGVARVLDEVVLLLLPGRRLYRLDGAVAQRLLLVRHDQAPVDADHAPEAAAGLAGAERRVEREQRRLRIVVAQVALGAMQPGGPAPADAGVGGLGALGQHVDVEATLAALQRQLDRLDHAHLLHVADAKAVGHHVEQLALALLVLDRALAVHAREAAGGQPLHDFLGRRVGRQLHRERDRHPRIALRRRALQQVGVDRVRRVVAHRQRRDAVEQRGRAAEQQLQVVVELRHRADGRARAAHRVGLVDGDRRRHAFDVVDGGAVHAIEELARVGREGLDIAPLAFRIQRVKHQARLARPARPRHHGEFTGANVEVEVLQVVLPRAADADEAAHGGPLEGRRKILGVRPASARHLFLALRGVGCC